MKRFIGTEIGAYSFNAANKTVALTSIPILKKSQLLLVVNTTVGGILYNFADPTNYGGTFAENFLTFNVSSAGMADTDELTIAVDVEDFKMVSSAERNGGGIVTATSDSVNHSFQEESLIELRKIRRCLEILIEQDIEDVE